VGMLAGGSRVGGGCRGVPLGWVGHSLLRHTEVPVVVVRGRSSGAGGGRRGAAGALPASPPTRRDPGPRPGRPSGHGTRPPPGGKGGPRFAAAAAGRGWVRPPAGPMRRPAPPRVVREGRTGGAAGPGTEGGGPALAVEGRP